MLSFPWPLERRINKWIKGDIPSEEVLVAGTSRGFLSSTFRMTVERSPQHSNLFFKVRNQNSFIISSRNCMASALRSRLGQNRIAGYMPGRALRTYLRIRSARQRNKGREEDFMVRFSVKSES